MGIEIRSDPEAFVDLAGDWMKLAAQDSAATVFHLPQYLGIWWNEFGAACDQLALVTIRDDAGNLTGLAPLARYPDDVVRFVGDPDVTDYLGPISRPADRQAVADVVVAEARRLDGREIQMHALAADSGWPQALEHAAKEAGLSITMSEQDACPRVSIEGGYEAYLASISSKLRHEVRRKERRLRAAGAMVVRIADAATIDADLEVFFEFTRADEGDKSEFFQHRARSSFFSALGAAFINHGLVRVVVLEMDGEPLAIDFGFSRNGTWSLYNMSYDRSRSDLSPGMVLVGETIRLAAEEGCTTFDFLRGREPYKYRFGATDLPVLQLVAE